MIFTWVIFRSSNLDNAFTLIQALVGNTNVIINIENDFLIRWILLIFISFLIVNFLPNIYEIMSEKYKPIIPNNTTGLKRIKFLSLYWKPNFLWAIITSIIAISSMIFISRGVVEFLYFDF